MFRALGQLAVAVATLGFALACSPPASNPYAYSLRLRVVDEQGSAIAGAEVAFGRGRGTTDAAGELELCDLYGPLPVVVAAPGYLSEPITVDRSDGEAGELELRLFAAEGPDGTPRWSMHAGGDAMFGRRYLEPPKSVPLLPSGDLAGGAEGVVAELRPLFEVADLRTLNLETVVADIPDEDAYPGKRFLLRSPPESLAGLEALSVDLVTLGNNHLRDYLDLGVFGTGAALDAASLAHVGLDDGGGDSGNPHRVELRPGFEVATFSYTTVDGDFVNDNYAGADDPEPAACGQPDAPDNCFMWEPRSWGCEGQGFSIASAERIIGEAWQAYDAVEAEMSPADQAQCWASLYAVYPELQDWVGRRGHAGAARWDEESSPAAIAAADDAGLRVVQLHSGFQFQRAPSTGLRAHARAAIDAGADIVIAHHPHVLQGLEWYRGKLIVYSLGNLIFDQDFLVTFASAFLRTVWEGDRLLEARLIPVELVGYRPIPSTGRAAARVVAELWELSTTPSFATRDAGGDVRRIWAGPEHFDADNRPAQLRLRHHSAVVVDAAPASEAVELALPAGGAARAIDYPGLIHAQAGGADVALGRELFGWGDLEDSLADDRVVPAAQWFLPDIGRDDPVLRVDEGAPEGWAWMQMYRRAVTGGDTFARPVARIPLPEHRLYAQLDGALVPADGEARYTIRMLARLDGGGSPYLRLELFHFDDTDPTADPTTEAIGGVVDLPFEVEAGAAWQRIEVELDPALLSAGGLRANVVLVRVRFAPPSEGDSVFAFDAFEFIEWREAAAMPDHFGNYGFVRALDGGAATITLEGRPLRDR